MKDNNKSALMEVLELHKEETGSDAPQEVEQEVNFMEDFFNTTISEYDEFDENAWAKKEGYKLPRFESIEENLEGLDEGLYLFAGESNSGKTGCMINVLFDACSHKENKLFGVYYTLDDSRQEVIPRVIAMNEQIPIGLVAKPARFQNQIDETTEGGFMIEEQLKKRDQGIKNLKELNKQFKMIDSNKVEYAEDMYEHMKAVYTYIKAYDEEYNMIVAVDALNDIRFRDKGHMSKSELNAEIAKTTKRWAVEFGMPVLGSTHLRKLNANRRPNLDDLKDSVEYVYESSVTFLVYNDVSKNGEAASVFYYTEGSENKSPILELDWAKNKKSSFKGRTFYTFVPEHSRIDESSKDDSNRFNALIYEN